MHADQLCFVIHAVIERTPPIDGSVTFGWFVRNRYYPLKEGNWLEETAKPKKGLIQTHLSTR